MIILNNKEIISKETFPDGTPLIKLPLLNHNKHNKIMWRYESMAELFILYSLTKQIKQKTKTDVRLVMPYVPNARQDRLQNFEDVFTLKWFCEIINSLEFSRVAILDIHSNVTPALLNNCHSVRAKIYIEEALEKCNADILFFPDNGALKKYSEYLKLPYAYGIKNRNWQNGEIKLLEIFGNVKNKDVMIVDDICSYGGTFLKSAKKLKELGANKIYLYITHCENNILDGELINSQLIEKIYTTDSIFSKQHELINIRKIGGISYEENTTNIAN